MQHQIIDCTDNLHCKQQFCTTKQKRSTGFKCGDQAIRVASHSPSTTDLIWTIFCQPLLDALLVNWRDTPPSYCKMSSFSLLWSKFIDKLCCKKSRYFSFVKFTSMIWGPKNTSSISSSSHVIYAKPMLEWRFPHCFWILRRRKCILGEFKTFTHFLEKGN